MIYNFNKDKRFYNDRYDYLDFPDDLFEYPDNEYIGYVVEYIADRKVDIYTQNLLAWIKDDPNSVEYMEDAVIEGLIEPAGRDYDFLRHIMAAQFESVRSYILYNMSDAIELAFNKELENLGYKVLNQDELMERVEEIADDCYNFTIGDLKDKCRELKELGL